MISDALFNTQNTSQKTWLNKLETSTLIELGFSLFQISNIRACESLRCVCPDFEKLEIRYSTLLFSGIPINTLHTALLQCNSDVAERYYDTLLIAFSTVLNEIYNKTALETFLEEHSIIPISNTFVKELTSNEISWLGGVPNLILRKLGFSDYQIIYCNLFYSPTNYPTIPDFERVGIHKNTLIACGIPLSYLKEGICNKYSEIPITAYFEQILIYINALPSFDFLSGVNVSTSTINPIPLTPEPIQEQTTITIPSETSTDSYCVVDDERGVVYVSESNGIETMETAHDLAVKYTGCYGLYQDIVIKVREINQYDDNIHIKFYPVTKNSDTYNYVTKYISPDFNFSLPKLGVINTDFDVFCVERLHKRESPARYRKGLLPECLVYKNLCYFENASLKKPDLIGSWVSNSSFYRIAEYIFKPIFFTYQEALDSVLNIDRVAAAFSSAYAIKIDLKINRVLLLRYEYVIGTYSVRYNKWTMLTDAFNKSLTNLGVPL